jgi:transcriptional regulator with XRE-family HTH domain
LAIQLRGLERERVRRALTRKQLAELAGVTYTYVTELESGKRRAGQDVVRRLSAALAATPIVDGADALIGSAT